VYKSIGHSEPSPSSHLRIMSSKSSIEIASQVQGFVKELTGLDEISFQLEEHGRGVPQSSSPDSGDLECN